MVNMQEQEIFNKKEVNKKENLLLSPKYDVVFHALFRKGNENITKALIQDITGREYKRIDMDKNVVLSNDDIHKKNEILDLKVELDDGEICNIEIQLSNKKNFKERILEYWAKLYSGQLTKGQDYIKLKRTILIAIIDFDIKQFINEGYHTKWRIREDKNRQLILTNDFEIHIIEMKKANKILKDNKNDRIAQWMTFFDNPNSVEVKKMSEENEDINQALEQLRKLSSNKELVELMDRQDRYERDRRAELQYATEEAMEKGMKQGIEQGIKQGIEQGIKQGIEQGLKDGERNKMIQIAKKCLEKEMDLKEILEITGLNEEEILKLKNEEFA